MAMSASIAKILIWNGVHGSNANTSSSDRRRRSNVDSRTMTRLNLHNSLCSGAKLNEGFLENSAQRWNPSLERSWKISRKGMRIRGSQFDGGVPDSGNSKTTSTFDNQLDSNHAQGSSASAAVLTTPPVAKGSIAHRIEDSIERAIIDCRFLTLFGVVGSLLGSMLCFLQGSLYVVHSFKEYVRAYLLNVRSSQVILYLVEAVDVYLMGTVMLIFGMGLHELFVSSLKAHGGNGQNGAANSRKAASIRGSNLFGLFALEERPKWLEIRSLDELKTKLGHVIVMILLVGMFEKSKRVPIHSGLDLLFFSGSILMASGCLYLLSMLHHNTGHGKGE